MSKKRQTERGRGRGQRGDEAARAPAPAHGKYTGRVEGHPDGHGFLVPEGGEARVFLSAAEMRQVLHGDRALVRVTGIDHRERPTGEIVEVVERVNRRIVGRLHSDHGVVFLVPEDRRIAQDILVPPAEGARAKPGQVVTVELVAQPSRNAQPIGRIAEVLGEYTDPGMEIEIALRKFDLPREFSRRAEAQARALPDSVREEDMKGRRDLRELHFVTIDGETAKDFDDAVYAQKEGKGFRLWVAIADVSHYVKHGDALDLEARERGTSVYFPRRVIPMLPEKLSNGLCSLNPDEDRLCMVCDMLVDASGGISAYQFFPGVMRSHARLTYNEVAAVLGNTRGPEAKTRSELVPHLIHLHEVYRALLKRRGTRGAVDFETTETQIVCDDNGRIERIVPRTRNEAHRLIEEAMLAANVCAAEFIDQRTHPALYRVHEGPTPEKRTTLQNYLRTLGLSLSLSDDPTPGELQAIALATRERPDATQIHAMLLRSMQQAHYTAANSGHFGLAYDAYTHFTSPIRRYPDLLVHRVIKALLHGRRYHLEGLEHEGDAKRRVAGKTAAKPGKAGISAAELEQWNAVGAHCSSNERRADEASRDVEAWLKCRFMRERLGEEFAGTVSAVTSFGLFVTLDDLYVDGLVHITEIGGGYYRYDEVRQELHGERSGQRYAAGTRVRVQVSRVDLDSRRIDFRMVREGEGERLLSRGRKNDARKARDELEQVQSRDREVKAGLARATKSRVRATAKTRPSGKATRRRSARR